MFRWSMSWYTCIVNDYKRATRETKERKLSTTHPAGSEAPHPTYIICMSCINYVCMFDSLCSLLHQNGDKLNDWPRSGDYKRATRETKERKLSTTHPAGSEAPHPTYIICMYVLIMYVCLIVYAAYYIKTGISLMIGRVAEIVISHHWRTLATSALLQSLH